MKAFLFLVVLGLAPGVEQFSIFAAGDAQTSTQTLRPRMRLRTKIICAAGVIGIGFVGIEFVRSGNKPPPPITKAEEIQFNTSLDPSSEFVSAAVKEFAQNPEDKNALIAVDKLERDVSIVYQDADYRLGGTKREYDLAVRALPDFVAKLKSDLPKISQKTLRYLLLRFNAILHTTKNSDYRGTQSVRMQISDQIVNLQGQVIDQKLFAEINEPQLIDNIFAELQPTFIDSESGGGFYYLPDSSQKSLRNQICSLAPKLSPIAKQTLISRLQEVIQKIPASDTSLEQLSDRYEYERILNDLQKG